MDPTGHKWKTFGNSFIGALVGGLVTGLAIVLSGGTLAPFAPLMFGAISGAVSGGLSGGWQGALLGAGMGLAMGGAVMLGGPLAAAGLLAGGTAYTYKQGGWAGVGDFASGLAGGILGGTAGLASGIGLGNAIKSGNAPNLASERGSIRVTRAKDSLSTDQKPQINPKLKTNYDIEGKAKSFDLIYEKDTTVYRQGKFADEVIGWPGNRVKGGEWAPGENPLTTPNFAKDYGLPLENSGKPDWVVGGKINGQYTVGQASPSYNNPDNVGGKLEVRPFNPDNDITLDWFHMTD